jgi:GntR family transcriptional regulator/MocR family aminotransferase
MPKLIEEIPLVSLNINSSSSVPLYKQLYNIFRQSILEGKYSPGQKLPGTRSLAAALNISRNTAVLAFEQLLIEGYIKGKIGSGTFVNEIPDNILNIKENINRKKSEQKIATNLISQLGSPGLVRRNISIEKIIPFQNGLPSLDEFPIKIWLKLNNLISRSLSNNHLGYGDAAGYRPFRGEIASYLRTYRAVNCSADQIIIVNGSQQGLDLIMRVLLKPGDIVWHEDPGYFGARASMLFAGAKIYPSPLDNEGLNIDYSSKKIPVPKLIYTTPSHQFPLGFTMSASRRIQLLQYASGNNCWIIEDDYDSEFRYSGSPLPSLQGMDKNSCVLYLGTFSKVLFPGLRLGYLVLPDPQMLEVFISAKSMMDRQSPIIEQMVTGQFLSEGHFTRHIRKMRTIYKDRQEFLINEIDKELDGIVKVNPSDSGMHIIVWLPENLDDRIISRKAADNNLLAYPISEYVLKFKQKPGLLLGYTAFDKSKLKTGAKLLKKIILSS